MTVRGSVALLYRANCRTIPKRAAQVKGCTPVGCIAHFKHNSVVM
jgi:hypothetical protein